jgi:hypothetical protein
VPTLIAHGWSYFRRRGLRATAGTIISRFVYGSRQLVVYRTRLAGPPAADHVGDIVFRLATPADVAHLDEFEPYGLGASQRAYVDYDHDWLFVACDGERIVATRRYSLRVPAGSLMSRRLQLGPRQVWSADAFCLPEYRTAASIGISDDLPCDVWRPAATPKSSASSPRRTPPRFAAFLVAGANSSTSSRTPGVCSTKTFGCPMTCRPM